MQFELSLDKLIASQAKLKVLRYLFGHPASMSENELARVIKTSSMTINRLMKELRELNLVQMERVGNANVWSVNKESYAYSELAKIISEISGASSPLEHLKATLSNHIPKELVRKVILYGSVSQGKTKVNSDIDLYILVRSSKEAQDLTPYLDKLSSLCLSLYGNRLAPYILTEAQLPEKNNLPILKEIEKGIPII